MLSLRTYAKHVFEWALLLLVVYSVLVRGGKGLDATWLLGALAVILTFARFWTRRKHPVSDGTPWPLWVALMAFMVWSVLSFVLSSVQNYGLDEIFRDASCILMFFWMAGKLQHETSDAFLRRFLTVLAYATLAACLIGVAVYVLQPVNRFVGTFFDYRFTTDYWPNAWAEFLLLTWPLAFLWLRRFSPYARIVILGFILGCLLLSFSRGAFLVFVAQTGLWFLIESVRLMRSGTVRAGLRRFIKKQVLILAGMAVVALVVFAGVNNVRSHYHDVESVAAKATLTSSEGATSVTERRDFWIQSFKLSLQKPVFGWGPYGFRFLQPRLQTEVFATSDHPHNVFLKLAMERGWPASILFALFLVLLLLPSLVCVLRTPPIVSTQLETLRLPALIAVTGVFAHNLIDYNLQFVGIALPLWMLLGAQMVPVAASPARTKAFRIAEVLVAVALGCFLVLEGRTLLFSSLGRHAEAQGDADAALSWYNAARGQIFSRDMQLSRAALFLQARDTADARAALDAYAAQNDQDARLWIMRGDVELTDGKGKQALQDFDVALAYGKYNYLEPLEGTLTVLSLESHPAELAAQKDVYLAIFNKFGKAILQNSHFIALSENVETFGRVSSLLQTLYPDQKKILADFTATVLQHAQEERDRSTARTPGLLW